ncbi:hypothetical protein [Luteimonas sp. RC10]|jgi:hypothetical protein|uniref:hypothetical protein n=1 Tax=Luteimonas sp. RC10 TaxID=2587035 RepID=UPI00160BE8F2|nr:hypothetical protein [Luteimonas sp. RC10]MBB3345122.1 hypothetical protein [Luteimonas sp. RC10]
MKTSIRWISTVCAVVCLGAMGTALAAPATPCTAQNNGATEYVPNLNGGAIYECVDGRWWRIAVCNQSGQCTYL